jgi:rubredoxin
MNREIIFTCPKCKGGKIEEIQVDITTTSEINVLTEENDPSCIVVLYGEQTNEGGHVERYQCGSCGFIICDDTSPHAEDGLDDDALVRAIDHLNLKQEVAKKIVSHDDLVRRLSDQYATLSGEELANAWNVLMDDQVIYDGDSLYWVE